MYYRLSEDHTEFSFETQELQGKFVVDSPAYSPNHRHHLREVLHKPTNTCVSPTQDAQKFHSGLCNFFRAYARNSWLTELRALPSQSVFQENGVQLIWSPMVQHQVKLTASFAIQEPNFIDIDIALESYGYYPDYELVFANYHAPSLKGGTYVKPALGGDGPIEEIRVEENAAFQGMYPFFPRDLHVASLLNDGRSQKGRWYYQPVCGRCYGHPLGFATNGSTEILLMGRTEDVAAVGVTYFAEDETDDDVAQHHALYLSLFGQDLHPGDGWRTQMRLVVQEATDSTQRLHSYQSFLTRIEHIDRRFEINPHSLLQKSMS